MNRSIYRDLCMYFDFFDRFFVFFFTSQMKQQTEGYIFRLILMFICMCITVYKYILFIVYYLTFQHKH